MRLRRPAVFAAALAALLLSVAPGVAEARGSSGGYSRPSSSVRTPSFGSGGSSRTPSFSSGGYSRPSSPSYRAPVQRAPQSAGDRSFSQDRSGSAFDAYQQSRRPSTAGPSPSWGSSGGSSAGGSSYGRSPSGPSYAPVPSSSPWGRFQQAPARSSWYYGNGWAPPVPGYFGAGRSFGAWDGLFLGALLSNLARPGAAQWFDTHRDDPGVQRWRQEADRAANDNPDLRRQLDELDRTLTAQTGGAGAGQAGAGQAGAGQDGGPKTPAPVPDGIPPELAEAETTRTPSAGSTPVWLVVLVVLAGAGGIAYLAYVRMRPTRGGSDVTPPNGSALGAASAMLRHKLSGEGYRPDKFRVGMTLQLDPTPFILAGDAIKMPQPEGTGSGNVSVSAIGEVTSGQTRLTRLYLPDERTLVQLHLDASGDPDECRLFGVIDEVTPSDPTEWGVWLDPNEGMIGWPQFQTKDGKTYDRVWVPGSNPISPRVLSETIEGLSGTRTVTSRAMLYSAPTGLADPAPAVEYILVEARQEGGRAWVEIRSGIDLNPVTLQLA